MRFGGSDLATRRSKTLFEEVGTLLSGLPGVFSTAQWGGRAYKLPGPGGARSRPKLVAHACCAETSGKGAAGRVTVSFKLPPDRAGAAVQRHDWIAPHSFRTLAPAGWVTATVSRRRQLATLGRLLRESRQLYGDANRAAEEPARKKRRRDRVAGHIDQVMRRARAKGWSPPEGEDF